MDGGVLGQVCLPFVFHLLLYIMFLSIHIGEGCFYTYSFLLFIDPPQVTQRAVHPCLLLWRALSNAFMASPVQASFMPLIATQLGELARDPSICGFAPHVELSRGLS